MCARTLQRPCAHGREQSPSANTIGVRGLGPRTFSAKRRSKFPRKSAAFARLALCAVRRYEKAAVRALEAPVTLGLAGQQFGRERLLAVRAHDLVPRFLGGDLGHVATLPVLRKVEAVLLERRALRWRRIAARRPEMDQAEEPLALRQADCIAAGLRAEHMRCPPVAREPTRVRCE
jgi:hypothetical protein